MLMRDECAVCILNQILRATDYMGLGEDEARRVFREALRRTAGTDYSGLTPPQFSGKVYGAIEAVTGRGDPYRELRKEQNDLVLGHLDLFRERIAGSPDPLFTAFLYSLKGNIIDYGGVEIFDTDQIFSPLSAGELTVNDYEDLKRRLAEAENVLIIADNAGEAVFDVLLMEQLKLRYPGIRIRYGVKSGPAINDVLKEDAEYIGAGKFAEIIETGSTCAGTVISDSSPEFRAVYRESGVVISKGQGNFETLEMEEDKDIFFIFKVKCRIVSDHSGFPLNSMILGFRSKGN